MSAADTLCEEFWSWRIQNFPEFGTAIGFHSYDKLLDDMTVDAYEERQNHAKDYLSKIDKCQSSGDLSKSDSFNLLLLWNDLTQFVAGHRFKTYLFPMNQLEGPQVDFPRLVSYMKVKTEQDYEMILERFSKFPKQIDEMITLLQRGIDDNYVMCDISIKPVPAQIKGLVEKEIEDLPFFKPFEKFDSGLDESVCQNLRKKCKDLIKSAIIPSYKKLSEYLEATYIPHARLTIGATDLPNGQEYYQKCLQFHTTTTLTASEIHEIGKGEVDRIKQRMEDVKRDAKFDGDLKEFQQHLRSDPRFVLKTGEEILEHYRQICDSIEKNLPKLFKTFPKAPFEIIKVPDEVAPNFPGAYYLAPPGDGSRPGTFYVNTFKPETRKTYEFVSLALHEAIPGHHHQASLCIEMKNTPKFRLYFEDRHYYEAPARFAMNTAYIEGWGLYSEYLGEELGLYDDMYTLFGRLSHEMLRAVRLVVDTGMHEFGWSRDDSIKYMLSNTAMSHNDVVAEVERYITWPGQACAYKIGELKLKELRMKASKELGDKFDVREFHDLVLLSGSLPLDILERRVDEFIAHSS